MMPRTKLLKRIQSAVLSFGASIAVAFDPILHRSITIVSIAPSNVILLQINYLLPSVHENSTTAVLNSY